MEQLEFPFTELMGGVWGWISLQLRLRGSTSSRVRTLLMPCALQAQGVPSPLPLGTEQAQECGSQGDLWHMGTQDLCP